MKRVASLYLPHWSIDRLRRAEPALAPRPERVALDVVALKRASDREQGGKQCDAPRNTGWRPGARWARSDPAQALARPLPGVDEATGGAAACWAGETRADVERRLAVLPAHQRPPMREMGRRSEAADHPYKRLPGDDGGKSAGWPEPGGAMVPVRFGGEGVRPGSVQRADPRPHPRMAALRTDMPSIRYPGDGPHPDRHAAKERRPDARIGSNDAGATVPPVAAFFDTGRTTAGTVARVCRDDVRAASATTPASPPVPAAPLVTVVKAGGRVQVDAASAEALALGIVPGMALTQVRAATPEVVVRDADPDGDAGDLRRLAIALARRWSPSVAIADAQSLFIDISGVAHLHGGERAMAARIVRLLARLGIQARIAIADTTGAAWAASHFAAGPGDDVVLLPPGDPLPSLAALPVAALRVDDAALELLRRLGINRVGQLVAMPRAPLVRRFGRTIAQRLDQASGRAPEPIDPVVPPVAIAVEQRFAEPLLTAEPIAYWIDRLVARLSVALAQAGRGARLLVLAATRVDAAVQVIRVGFARATRTPDHMRRLLVRRIETIDPGFGIDALALHVLRTEPLSAQAIDGDLAVGGQADMATLVDTIVNRIGARRLWRARALESDVPERSVGGAAPLDIAGAAPAALRADDVRRLDRRAGDHPWHPRWPRPARLLHRPEPVDGIMAELPDQPPRRFTWRGVTHRVVRGDGPERITGEWWRRSPERHAIRDYYQVEDEEGRRFWLFRRGDAERAETGDLTWYMHGTFG